MKCRKCKREIPDNSIFCNWCGHRQVTAADDVRVPKPRHKGNKWFGQVVVGENRVYISADSEEEYNAKAKAAKTRQIEIKKAPAKMTLGEAIDGYIKDNDAVLSPSTINAYKSYRKTRFLDYMDRQLDSIPYQRMINDECKKVSPKTVHNAWRLITASLKHANIPITPVNLPQKRKADRPWLDYQQIQILLDKCKGKPYELGILLGLHGLRRSEMLHLAADDIDLERGLIHVRGASVVGENNKLTDKDTTKTTSSSRTVNIVIPRLNDVVKDKQGRLLQTNPTTLYSLINKLCEKNGLPKVGVHGLRHSYISLCFHLGWNMQTVMQQGGYSNPQVVNEVYRHLAAQDASSDIDKMKQFYVNPHGPTVQ